MASTSTTTAAVAVPDVLDALDAQQRELAGLVEGLDDEALALPSACEGWDLADVLLHLAQTNEYAAASAQGSFPTSPEKTAPLLTAGEDVDDWAEAMVVADRGSRTEVRDRWTRSADAQLAAFRSCDLHAQVPWVAGMLAARTLASTRLSETWIHTGDVAHGLGVEPEPTDRLWHVARLAWRTVPYAFQRADEPLAGPVAFHLEAPDGSPWDFVAAEEPITVVRGRAIDLCRVAGQRADGADSDLIADGPDAEAVLRLVRTFA